MSALGRETDVNLIFYYSESKQNRLFWIQKLLTQNPGVFDTVLGAGFFSEFCLFL